jgi:Tol biopolymer transport system component
VEKLTHESAPNRNWSSVAWSPDGKTLYANRFDVSFTDSDVYAVDAASGKSTNLTPHQGNVIFVATSLSPDGETLLVTSNQKGGYQNVALLGVATKKLDCDRYTVGGEVGRFLSQPREVHVHPQRRRAHGPVYGGPRHAPIPED